MTRTFAVFAAFMTFFMLSPPTLSQEAGPFMDTAKLVEICKEGLQTGDAAARHTCETYLTGVFDAAWTIQSQTRREAGNADFTVLCNPDQRPNLEVLIENVVRQAEEEPESLKVGPGVYVIRTLNPPGACK